MTMHCKCPTCGQPVDAVPVKHVLDVVPYGNQRLVVAALADAYPRAVSYDFLYERVYSGTKEPEFSDISLRATLTRCRDKLTSCGWTINRNSGGRGKRASYKLERLPHDPS